MTPIRRGDPPGRPRRAAATPTPATGDARTRSHLAYLFPLLALLLASLAAPLAAAHTGAPERSERVKAGPYTLELRYYSAPRAGQPLYLMIVPVGGGQPTTIRATAEPGAGVDAIAARVVMAPDNDDPTATDAAIHLSTAGLWVVTIAADGPAGSGQAETSVLAAAPGAIPIPVGWAIGLTPIVGVIGFAVAQRRWLRSVTTRQGEATPASP
ncbi:MAG: hypothetical protein U0841_15840 [Chloroflexia bacterium]